MSDGRCELFVYYRVPVERADEALREVTSAQQHVAARFDGLAARLLHRGEPGVDGLLTWMETYRAPQGLDETVLAHLSEVFEHLPSARSGPRHEERFFPLV